MKEVAGSNLRFACEPNEVVTIEVTEKNTNWLFEFQPPDVGTLSDKVLTIKLGDKSKSVMCFFAFSASGGSYDVRFNGSASDDTFSRNISQTQSVAPEDRIYSFLVG